MRDHSRPGNGPAIAAAAESCSTNAAMTPSGDDHHTPSADAAAAAAGHVVMRRAVRIWTAALLMLCSAALFLLFRHIDRTLPYPQHIDETFISQPAANILVTGNRHPQRFNYPSLPTYIAATAMAAGFVRAATELQIRDVNQLGDVGYPHYDIPRVMGTARQAFAFLSVICIGMTGLSAWLAFRKPVTLLLAPLMVLVSPLYFRHSWVYLNVDIVGASFVMMTVAACLLGLRPGVRHRHSPVTRHTIDEDRRPRQLYWPSCHASPFSAASCCWPSRTPGRSARIRPCTRVSTTATTT
jgi:hypothetical protein